MENVKKRWKHLQRNCWSKIQIVKIVKSLSFDNAHLRPGFSNLAGSCLSFFRRNRMVHSFTPNSFATPRIVAPGTEFNLWRAFLRMGLCKTTFAKQGLVEKVSRVWTNHVLPGWGFPWKFARWWEIPGVGTKMIWTMHKPSFKILALDLHPKRQPPVCRKIVHGSHP